MSVKNAKKIVEEAIGDKESFEPMHLLARVKMLLRVFEMQDMSEREIGQSVLTNGRGFNAFDAPILTSFSIQLIHQGYLSWKQHITLNHIIRTYTGQVAKIQMSEGRSAKCDKWILKVLEKDKYLETLNTKK